MNIKINEISFKFKKNINLRYLDNGVIIIEGYKQFVLDNIGKNNIQLFKTMLSTYISALNIMKHISRDNLLGLIKLDICEYAIYSDDIEVCFNILPQHVIEFIENETFIVEKYIFSYIEEGAVIYEIPLNRFQISSKNDILELIFARLKKEINFNELYYYVISLNKKVDKSFVSFIVQLLLENNLIKKCNTPNENVNVSLNRWERHDLLFHMKSRNGFHDNPVGRTYPFKDIEPPYEGKKHIEQGKYKEIIPLIKPESNELNMTLNKVLEERSSTRKYASDPITFHQLSLFLYYSHYVRSIIPKSENQLYESSKRNYPSGGGSYSLEIYLVVHKSSSLAAGIYYYCPYNHALYSMEYCASDYNKLLLDAKYANGAHELPDTLLIITSRFGRMNWKYQTMAYSSILKDVGALFMNMYCVATALKIGVCALGCGDIATFKNVIKNEIWEESSVGEMSLGSIEN